VPGQTASDLDQALVLIGNSHVHAITIGGDGVFVEHLSTILEFATANRLPTSYSSVDLVHQGIFMGYGPRLAKQYRRAAYFVDRVVRGAKPADLPLEEWSEIDLAVNRRTAEATGLAIPPTAAAQLTEWID